MSLVLDDLPRDPDRLLLMAQQMVEVIAQQNASIVSLQTERDAAQSKWEVAQAEIEKLRLLIRQLQRGQFGRRSERRAALSSARFVGRVNCRVWLAIAFLPNEALLFEGEDGLPDGSGLLLVSVHLSNDIVGHHTLRTAADNIEHLLT